ncbi:L,D-transpeptidase [Aurantimonas sp. DM33-3]|nr:L,D-transpeptidase [Aurantimonas sp. DM33-3]
MINRRQVLAGVAAWMALATEAGAHGEFQLDPQFKPQRVAFSGYRSGTIVIDPRAKFLYLMEEGGFARRYGIGVGRAGLRFSGRAVVGLKAKWPRWTPTSNMIKRDPGKYARYAGGLKGGPGNPLGARALYLYRDGKDTLYRIHGTNQPSSIGKAVSNGCIRMLNDHVSDLYERVSVGTEVVVR